MQATYLEGPGYLIVEVVGQWDDRASEQTIKAIREEAIRRGQTRIYLNMLGVLPPNSCLTRFFTGALVAKHWGPPFRVAAFWKREFYDGFAETAAVNRGANLRTFFEEKPALDWLLQPSGKYLQELS